MWSVWVSQWQNFAKLSRLFEWSFEKASSCELTARNSSTCVSFIIRKHTIRSTYACIGRELHPSGQRCLMALHAQMHEKSRVVSWKQPAWNYSSNHIYRTIVRFGWQPKGEQWTLLNYNLPYNKSLPCFSIPRCESPFQILAKRRFYVRASPSFVCATWNSRCIKSRYSLDSVTWPGFCSLRHMYHIRERCFLCRRSLFLWLSSTCLTCLKWRNCPSNPEFLRLAWVERIGM